MRGYCKSKNKDQASLTKNYVCAFEGSDHNFLYQSIKILKVFSFFIAVIFALVLIILSCSNSSWKISNEYTHTNIYRFIYRWITSSAFYFPFILNLREEQKYKEEKLNLMKI